ncbi:aminodeoxychorismate lyase [Methylomonas rivi]|uniref:Aminodeoxychorismate lyase n=1 Tax=Methylomonas rivi TaxID=2952226 RepID=A0ABT1U581_9GAMM|nr:aminodeoxychorismate lyase [Methylomonas sp. WSC-6]
MFLLNGESRHCVDVSDRGFQYGDGLFETIAVCNGRPLFLQRHLNRLLAGCRRLLIPPPDLSLLESEARQLSAGADRAVLKLMVTRGIGGRGYRQPDQIVPTRLFSLHPSPNYPDSYQTDGIVARFCEWRLAINPGLAGIKHMNRLEQVLARAEWWDESVQEGLMFDSNDCIVEGTMSNLFFAKAGILHTPLLVNCGIEGILRQIVIEFAIRYGLGLAENHFNKQDVLEADEVFVTNSVIGVWPVKQLENQCFDVGRITRDIQQWYAGACEEEANL